MPSNRDVAFVPEILLDAVRAEFKGRKALLGSGAVISNASLPTGKKGGDTVEIPTFGLLGELEDIGEGVELALKDAAGSRESSTVARAGKAFEMSKWKEIAEAHADPYAEFARQIREAAMRRWDTALIDKAVATSGLPARQVIDRFNAGSPVKLSWSFMVDGRMSFGDEGADLAMAVVHSKVMGDLAKETDSQARPLLIMPTEEGQPARVAGVPCFMSDRVPVEFPSVTATGTTPPAVTMSTGSTKYSDMLRIEITTGGARGTAVFRYSWDGGSNWTSGVTTAATVALNTPEGDASGITVAFAVGTYATDNVYVGVPKYTTIVARRGALVLWYNGEPVVEEDRIPRKDTRLGVVNTYYVAHRYARAAGGTRPGIALLKHN